MNLENIMILAGSGSRRLTELICNYLQISPGRNETLHFSEGNVFVRVLENVRGLHVYIIQSTVFPTNDNFMEILFWIDALKRASAETVTAVIPYFNYGKGEKMDEPRVSIRARVCADAIEAAGADRVVTMDIHAPSILGFFHIPVDNLFAFTVLCNRIREERLKDIIIVSPDIGFAKQARKYAAYLDTSVVLIEKERVMHNENAKVLRLLGEVNGNTAIIVDDFAISGNTLVNASKKLKDNGAREIYAMITHGVLTEGSIERINRSPIKKLLLTDTVENQPVKFSKKIEVVSVAPIFGEAINRIHTHKSISAMFTE